MSQKTLEDENQVFVSLNFQCEFTSETEPCEYCASQNLICQKIMAPIKSAKEFEEIETIMSPISLIYDPELSDRKLQLLRRLHNSFAYPTESRSSLSVILQHLWSTYGMVFEDRCLHFTVMAYSSTLYAGAVMKAESVKFLSKVNHHLIAAIRADAVSETHLFAIFFAVAVSQYGPGCEVVPFLE